VCIVIIKGYYREKVIYSALETESDIHFETNFFGKNDTHFETDGVFIFLVQNVRYTIILLSLLIILSS
jgi:hypothetical protein